MKVASCPNLDFPGFEIRPLHKSDAENWFVFASDQEVMQFTSCNITELGQLHELIDRANSDQPGTLIQYAIAESRSNKFVGMIGFHSISERNHSAEITYELSPDYWGRGLASASCIAAVDWAFATLGWVRIQATVVPKNVASIKVLQNSGFEYEGTLRHFRMVHGEPCDFKLFSRTS